ncbi:hypothetical protein FHR84_001937 [Actinopolyspora biskrensis]|uniref:Uncharacterized protein n=1 Tax=Actinopolyspora biskrensis TaxID=1470178 RepID=A0A852YY11_9ACTN|nr:hypothetical protein [Actinopolyspora biskrensis]NYH78612.1 hypothetical protein [Actinopolyspora biskrensis]
MPISARFRERVRDLLDPGEEIRYVFPAELVGSFLPDVVFVVSDRATVVLSTTALRRDRPRRVLSRNPRGARLGPVDTNTTPWFTFYGVHYHVDDDYVAVINAAAEPSRGEGQPPDPLPDL